MWYEVQWYDTRCGWVSLEGSPTLTSREELTRWCEARGMREGSERRIVEMPADYQPDYAEQGYESWCGGVSKANCPYPKGSLEAAKWQDGWEDAEAE